MNAESQEVAESWLAQERAATVTEQAGDPASAEVLAIQPGAPRFFGLVREVRNHAYGYSILAAFMLAGPFVTNIMFPEAPFGIGIIGGFAFGVYAALSAVPDKFL